MEPRSTYSSEVKYNTPNSNLKFFKKISWGSIIAGFIVAIVIQLLLSILGLGIGVGSINPMEESHPFQGLGTGTLIWWIITMLISLFIGGWVAGRQSNLPEKTDRILHGILMWCIFTLFSVYFFTSAIGSIIGGVGSIVGKTLSVAGNGIAAVAPSIGNYIIDSTPVGNVSLKNIKNEAEQLLSQTGKKDLQPGNLENRTNKMKGQTKNTMDSVMQDPQQAKEEIGNLIDKLVGQGKDVTNDADKEALVNIIVNRSGKSRAEAEAQVNNWQATVQQAKASFEKTKQEAILQAKKTGEDIASAVSKIAIFGFIGLLLGAIVSAIGSIIVKPDYVAKVDAGSKIVI
jgi:ElaB/YqjD/DUF883 family membrane-anchored ribosome-binding protein